MTPAPLFTSTSLEASLFLPVRWVGLEGGAFTYVSLTSLPRCAWRAWPIPGALLHPTAWPQPSCLQSSPGPGKKLVLHRMIGRKWKWRRQLWKGAKEEVPSQGHGGLFQNGT